MKRILTNMLMAVAITGPFVTSLAAETHLEANIPFAFVAANQTMPAGRYTVSQYRLGSPIFQLNDGRRKAIFVQLGKYREQHNEQPSLTFACYGNERILAKVTDAMGTHALSQDLIDQQGRHKIGVASMISVKLTAR